MTQKLLQQIKRCLQRDALARRLFTSGFRASPVAGYIDGLFAVRHDDELWRRSGIYLFINPFESGGILRYAGIAGVFARRLRYSSITETFHHERFSEASAGRRADIYLLPVNSKSMHIAEERLIRCFSPDLNVHFNSNVVISRAAGRSEEMLRRVRLSENGIVFASAASGWSYCAAESALADLVERGLVRVIHSISKCNGPCRIIVATEAKGPAEVHV